MKIIDFEKKGNVVRFILGRDDCEDYWGDDWNDTPYEHNAGEVYDRYITGYRDVAYPFGYMVLEPCEDWNYSNNSPWSKEDMKKRITPCIVVVPEEDNWWKEFSKYSSSDSKDIKKYYFGDLMEPSDELVCAY